MKKVLSVLIAAALAATLVTGLAACKKEVPYDPANFLPEGTAENPYQIVKEPVTITVFVIKTAMNPLYETMVAFRELMRLTNLKFKFIEASAEAYPSLRTVTWENKEELPDLFLFSNTIAEQMIYAKLGALTPWNDSELNVRGVEVGSLIDNYMPNYNALLESNFNHPEETVQARDVVTLEDGKMYSIVCCNDLPRDRTFKMYLNVQWIRNLNEDYDLGLSLDPTTIDEFLAVLRAFKKYDANRNGDPNDEIPVSAISMFLLRNFLLAPYGYVSNGVEIENDRSKFTYVPATDAYRNYLRLSKLMYSEGLLDNSTFEITTGTQLAGKGYDNRLGCWADAAAYLTVGTALEDNYTSFGPLFQTGHTEKTYQYALRPIFSPEGAVIPTGSPYVREIARLLDIMYSDFGVALMSVGREGVDWHWEDAEKTSWHFDIPEDWEGTEEEFRAKISPSVGTGCALYVNAAFDGKQNNPTLSKVNREAERYMGKVKMPEPEDFKMQGSEYEAAAVIKGSLDVYVQMTEASFIKGNKGYDVDSDADWNNYLKNLEGYNYKKLLEIYNTALARQK